MTNITEVRVRYAETDQMGVVYHANYFIWMEIGRTNLLREAGIIYRELEQKGYILPVVRAFAKFAAPSFYDDVIFIHSTATYCSGPKIRIDYRLYKDEKQMVCEGYTEHAFLSSETKKIVKAPDFFTSRIVLPDNLKEFVTRTP